MLQFTQSPRRKGLFGSPAMGQGIMPGDQPDYGWGDFPLGRPSALPGGNPGGPTEAPAQQRAKPNWGGIAASFLSGMAGQKGFYLENLQDERDRADKAREYQQRRQDDRAEWQYRQDNAKSTASPYRTEDNAGNVWEMGEDGQFKPIFTDPNDKVFMQDGQMITVPNRVRSAAPSAPAVDMPTVSDEASYGAIPPGSQYRTPDGSIRVKGGAAAPAMPPFPDSGADPLKAPGRMTSGRRTVEGNRLVGGKANSRHLSGDAADYVGSSVADLRRYFGPRVKIIPESDHNHVQGIGNGRVPFFGKRGTTGLRNR